MILATVVYHVLYYVLPRILIEEVFIVVHRKDDDDEIPCHLYNISVSSAYILVYGNLCRPLLGLISFGVGPLFDCTTVSGLK